MKKYIIAILLMMNVGCATRLSGENISLLGKCDFSHVFYVGTDNIDHHFYSKNTFKWDEEYLIDIRLVRLSETIEYSKNFSLNYEREFFRETKTIDKMGRCFDIIGFSFNNKRIYVNDGNGLLCSIINAPNK